MINVGIVGYGNLGKGVHMALSQNIDMELKGVFTRRNPKNVDLVIENTTAYLMEDLKNFKNDIDVLILCGGSATDLPVQTQELLKDFNTVDSFDTHAKIPEYFNKLDKIGKENDNISIISIGWDPGLFSIARMIFGAALPNGKDYTFWGSGVSQGHSDAIRRIEGVKNGIQYTIPIKQAIENARSGRNEEMSTREKHIRECYVVVEENADKSKIEFEIKNMPNYFSDYDTKIHFITEEELKRDHSGMPHGGFVIRSGKTGVDNSTKQIMEFSLKLDSNPEFTASVLVAYARACSRMKQENKKGCFTVFDIPISYLSPKTSEELRENLL